MTDYTKLVKALRCKRDDCEGCDLAFFDKDEGWMCQFAAKDDDAAAAIEALNRLLDQNTQRCEALRKQLREAHESYERHLNELEAQLPKRGKWELIDGAEPMRWGCSRCKYMSWDTSNYCPRCGAKMEVQE